ncbi:hypothetical protein CFK37_06320 [Virgibacillus phasianinus]|uniref:Regulatory protein YycH-like domain-containing protein n=1 Tax=Virgibacillus phasianinus TaxID=2017483 RepID=A0A220U0Z9_9BACI|nr:two-component system regulatory protein YycI [Virgibacillus phasianinus]ASK61798.1 hypothetical protein CFK37_06320 [Virgibacillus phasianinus]
MQWTQIKTLFILCFLVLDVFLLVQFIQKQDKEDLEVLKDEQEESIQKKLAADDIEIRTELPEEELTGSYISINQQIFSEENRSMVKSTEDQETAIINNDFIISRLKEQVSIDSESSDEEIESLVKEKLKIISPDSYVFWDWNKELNVLLFFQEKKKKPLYYNRNGLILVFLNDRNEISFYTQALLGDVEKTKSQRKLSQPIQAIDVLYQKNSLNPGDEITKVDIGYYTRIPLENVTQVFAPTWKITVNNERNYFVNALEGYIFSSNDLTFLGDTLSKGIISKVNTIRDNKDLKQYFLTKLTKRIEIIDEINRSESE